MNRITAAAKREHIPRATWIRQVLLKEVDRQHAGEQTGRQAR
jgi:hypothetical protein